MKFVVIEIERLTELGIDTMANIKSRDGNQVLIHETIIQDKIDTTTLKKYEKGSVELIGLLNSPDWINETDGYEAI